MTIRPTLCLALLAAVPLTQAADWPHWRGPTLNVRCEAQPLRSSLKLSGSG